MVEAGNNVGSDSHKLGGSCCGYAAIASRMHDVRSAQGDERGDVGERSESNLRQTQSGDRRARLNFAPPEHEKHSLVHHRGWRREGRLWCVLRAGERVSRSGGRV